MDIQAFLAEDRGASVIATASLMIVFCTVFVVLRYYARFLSGTLFSIEDILIPFAWLAETGLCINAISKTCSRSILWHLLTANQ
jgi:hypothetical protein